MRLLAYFAVALFYTAIIGLLVFLACKMSLNEFLSFVGAISITCAFIIFCFWGFCYLESHPPKRKNPK